MVLTLTELHFFVCSKLKMERQVDPNDRARELSALCDQVTQGGGKPEEGQWVDHDNDPSTPKIFVRGAHFDGYSKKHDVRTATVVEARYIDKKRDEHIGIPLSQYNINYIFAEPDERDKRFKSVYGAPRKTLPPTSDLRAEWGNILDQQDLGSCVAHSIAYCLRYCMKKQKIAEFTPSRLFIYYNGRMLANQPVEEDAGLTIRDGYKSICKFSACDEKLWEYEPNSFSRKPPEPCYVAAQAYDTFRYISLDNDAQQIKQSLSDGFPVSFGAALFESFYSEETAKTGMIPMPDEKKEKRLGGHAMTLVGHDDEKQCFLLANSWSDWALGGFAWIPYKYIENDDFCGDFWSPRYFGE